MNFTELLSHWLSLKQQVQVDHGPLWEELQDIESQLNETVMDRNWAIELFELKS